MTTKHWLIGGAVAAAALLGWAAYGKVHAADLKGGDCCADLEERVAELEATTVKSGNRKVRLTISGVIHKGLLYHSNDTLPGESKASIYDGTQDPSRVRFAGEAKVSKDWAAGFVIEIAFANNSARGVDTGKALLAIDGPDGKNEFQVGETGSLIRHSYVYMRGLAGELSLGQQSIATDGIIEINTANSNVATRPLQTMPMNMGGALSGLYLPFDGFRATSLKYTTPTFGGFAASAAWQQDESWDAALRFSHEVGGFRIAAGVGYRDQKSQTFANLINLLDVLTVNLNASHKATSGSISVMHMVTGLYANAYASQIKYDGSLAIAVLPPLGPSASFDIGSETVKGWGAQAGIQRNWTGWGATTAFALYEKQNGEFVVSDMTTYGVGVVQSFDQLGLDLYATFKRHDVTASPVCVGICKETDVFMAGAAVRF